MRTWTASTTLTGPPEEVLAVLTSPEAVARWAPVPFAVEALATERLVAGSRARVTGSLAGQRVGFDVEVLAADEEGLELIACGPVELDVAYALRRAAAGSEMTATVSVRGSGLAGRMLARATEALLAGGALSQAVVRIRDEVESTPSLALAA